MTKLFPAREMKHIQQKLVLNCDKVNLLNDISQNDSSFGMSFTNYSDHFFVSTEVNSNYQNTKHIIKIFPAWEMKHIQQKMVKNSSRICLYRNCR